MNILILGSGGREHALAWKINQSQQCEQLFVAPGNAGTTGFAKNVNLTIDNPEKFEAIKTFILSENIDLIIVGPEAPLVAGITDYLETQHELKGLAVVGPGKEGARLEGSKDFAKTFMHKYQIPTARSQTFTKNELKEGLAYLKSQSLPIVLKADGLAAGKGVLICSTLEEAQTGLEEMLAHRKFGEASAKVVIETFLDGIELSVFVLTDGKSYKILPEAKDYKRIGDGDTGPNTGGMGAVSPVPFANADFMNKVEKQVIQPTIKGLAAENITYRGFIFIGLMNVQGNPYVIEYNVRMGDPETQVVIPRIKSDLLPLLSAAATGHLDTASFEVSETVATTVVMASGGYPDAYEKGKAITGIPAADKASIVFHAGTTLQDNQIATNGGRVLTVTGLGTSMREALRHSYETVRKISWEGVQYRNDIGQDLIRLM